MVAAFVEGKGGEGGGVCEIKRGREGPLGCSSGSNQVSSQKGARTDHGLEVALHAGVDDGRLADSLQRVGDILLYVHVMGSQTNQQRASIGLETRHPPPACVVARARFTFLTSALGSKATPFSESRCWACLSKPAWCLNRFDKGVHGRGSNHQCRPPQPPHSHACAHGVVVVCTFPLYWESDPTALRLPTNQPRTDWPCARPPIPAAKGPASCPKTPRLRPPPPQPPPSSVLAASVGDIPPNG